MSESFAQIIDEHGRVQGYAEFGEETPSGPKVVVSDDVTVEVAE